MKCQSFWHELHVEAILYLQILNTTQRQQSLQTPATDSAPPATWSVVLNGYNAAAMYKTPSQGYFIKRITTGSISLRYTFDLLELPRRLAQRSRDKLTVAWSKPVCTGIQQIRTQTMEPVFVVQMRWLERGNGYCWVAATRHYLNSKVL